MHNLSITSDQSLEQVQKAFHAEFPFLKIEFFTKKHHEGGSSWSKNMIQDIDKLLKELGSKNENGVLIANSRMKVSDFEQEFQNIFGFGVQVFRKSKEIWLETTQTDDWNLEYQNHQGKEHTETFTSMEYDPREES